MVNRLRSRRCVVLSASLRLATTLINHADGIGALDGLANIGLTCQGALCRGTSEAGVASGPNDDILGANQPPRELMGAIGITPLHKTRKPKALSRQTGQAIGEHEQSASFFSTQPSQLRERLGREIIEKLSYF